MNSTVYQRLCDAAPEAFEGSPVAFAYLFGSMATRRDRPDSDVDVAAYLDAEPAGSSIDTALDLTARLFDASGVANIEVVVLNGAPLGLRGRAVQQRKVIYSRDEPARVRFESATLREFFDFQLHQRPLDEQFLHDIAEGRR